MKIAFDNGEKQRMAKSSEVSRRRGWQWPRSYLAYRPLEVNIQLPLMGRVLIVPVTFVQLCRLHKWETTCGNTSTYPRIARPPTSRVARSQPAGHPGDSQRHQHPPPQQVRQARPRAGDTSGASALPDPRPYGSSRTRRARARARGNGYPARVTHGLVLVLGVTYSTLSVLALRRQI